MGFGFRVFSFGFRGLGYTQAGRQLRRLDLHLELLLASDQRMQLPPYLEIHGNLGLGV